VTTITILGLGEAGRLYARGLAEAGAIVRGYDPHHSVTDPAIDQCADLAAALAEADIVLSLVGGRASIDAAERAMPHVGAGAVYADLNTASPETKREVAARATAAGVAMVDVAILAPVVRAGHRTPHLASGSGAGALAERLGPFGVPIALVPGEPGEAARLRLLRSVFMKGLAALVVESLAAGRDAGAEEWLRSQIAAELGPDGEALVDRLVDGTRRHAARREHEVREALAALEAAGQHADMTRATLAWLARIGAEGEL
jgi:3-hydroxyisobutyrate dehydrogenase-like beta-hydroxyacid dehydrogenase